MTFILILVKENSSNLTLLAFSSVESLPNQNHEEVKCWIATPLAVTYSWCCFTPEVAPVELANISQDHLSTLAVSGPWHTSLQGHSVTDRTTKCRPVKFLRAKVNSCDSEEEKGLAIPLLAEVAEERVRQESPVTTSWIYYWIVTVIFTTFTT